MHVEDLPDRVHIEALREALWRPRSRASVMVGAGMSCNAQKLSASVPDFPLWRQLEAGLKTRLGPWVDGYDALRLGQMFENTYGRGRLDDWLLEQIPDGQYEPGILHERLMMLPWADIFTTNYDTLLERTCTRVPRRYDVVEAPSDLTRAEAPRIVKLHGSFPARRPFIFTAEDYRRYPTDFAPFVNLVRQSAMENVLCLIGFSGEDPNFLQWAGWVRDQLGTTAPKMYLCGAFDLTTPQRAYYQHMQVIPVDLGPIFPARDWGSARHRASVEWLLASLRNGKPVDRGNWPSIEANDASAELPARYPPCLPPQSIHERHRKPKHPEGELDAGKFDELLKAWRSERESYPGWAVCPERRRLSLKYSLPAYFRCLGQPTGIKWVQALTTLDRLRALREIAWQAEIGLFPLPQSLPVLMESTLEELNPRPRWIELPGAAITPDTAGSRVNWDEITEAWIAVAFALVRHAWQYPSVELHQRWMGRLQGVIELFPAWRARWWHEKCWHHLIRLEIEEARNAAVSSPWTYPEGRSTGTGGDGRFVRVMSMGRRREKQAPLWVAAPSL
ncbi:SIR2 family protein, partial [Polyangium sp. y55x31]|uniref:SIR2 family NAD-dependent protein deacylase n=1 Tax=Polyangium sp. y55x31 TaxID=3042688 RepID=UPI0024821F2C